MHEHAHTQYMHDNMLSNYLLSTRMRIFREPSLQFRKFKFCIEAGAHTCFLTLELVLRSRLKIRKYLCYQINYIVISIQLRCINILSMVNTINFTNEIT